MYDFLEILVKRVDMFEVLVESLEIQQAILCLEVYTISLPINNIKVKVSHKRPRWPKGFRVG
jgi:hypothetical protein